MKKTITFIAAFLFSPAALAENVCPPYKAQKYEPTELIIKESDYSYKNAMEALSILGNVTIKPEKELKGTEKYNSTANAEIVLKGYILRTECLLNKNQTSCAAFCKHMEKRPWWFD